MNSNFPDCGSIISSGRCKGDCCGPVPFHKDDWEKLKFQTLRPVIEVMKMGDDHVIPFGIDLSCVFLNGDYSCSIYDQRPEACRKFGDFREKNKFLKCPHCKGCKK